LFNNHHKYRLANVFIKTFRGINGLPPGKAGPLPFIPRCLDKHVPPCYEKIAEGWREGTSGSFSLSSDLLF